MAQFFRFCSAIRQQLINTEDIRRMRKKAPCTRPDIWIIEKSVLEDEIFNESIITGERIFFFKNDSSFLAYCTRVSYLNYIINMKLNYALFIFVDFDSNIFKWLKVINICQVESNIFQIRHLMLFHLFKLGI